MANHWTHLKPGDLVDVIAPGFGWTDDRLRGAVEFLEKQGLRARVPSDIIGEDIICSQTDDIRFRHLKSALYAKDSNAIWCLRGGYGAIRIIDRVAKLQRPKRPKLFVGYSDAVTLHNYFNHFWRWPTLHGPLLDRLGRNNLPDEQIIQLLDLIFGRNAVVRHDDLVALNRPAQKISNRGIQGRMFGGNLTVIQSFLGTKYEKAAPGTILFFEDIGERGYRVDRILVQLQQAGYFRGTNAIVFGEFIESLERSGEDRVPGVVRRFANELKIPVFGRLQVGHGDNQRPMPLATPSKILKASGEMFRLEVEAGFER